MASAAVTPHPQAQFMLQEPVRDASGKQELLVMLNASALTAITVHEQGLSTLAFIFGAQSGAPNGAFARQSDPPAHPLPMMRLHAFCTIKSNGAGGSSASMHSCVGDLKGRTSWARVSYHLDENWIAT